MEVIKLLTELITYVYIHTTWLIIVYYYYLIIMLFIYLEINVYENNS